MSRRLSSSSLQQAFGSGGSDGSPPGLSPLKAARFLAVAFALYVALVLPPVWRSAGPAYTHLLLPPVSALAALVDAELVVSTEGPYLVFTRAYPPAAVRALDDYRHNPLFFHWLNALVPDLQRATYRWKVPPLPPAVAQTPTERALSATARPLVKPERLDIFRLTLEVPLFVALLLALPAIPWRRRLRPLLLGLLVFYVLHVALCTCFSLWMSQRVGNLSLDPAGQILDATSVAWRQPPDRYQYLGPVLAFLLTFAFLLLDTFRPRKPRAKATP